MKLILEDFVSTNTDYFQYSFFKLSNPDLKVLEKKTNNDWIKETLINIFEQISLKYIQNLIDENERHKIKNRKNILIYLKSYFEKCLQILEIPLFKIKQEKIKVLSNNNLIKLFSISFIRVYLKVFIDWINKNKLTKSIEIEEIIKAINGKKDNNFRDIIKCFIYKIIYNNNKQDISKLFEQDTINKYHLNSYSNYDLLQKEKNSESFKKSSFKEGYKPIISLIKENNDSKTIDEQKYPYYKSFFYSDYPDINFFRNKFKEKNKRKYPVVDLFLNQENYEKELNKDFICFNFVIKSLLCQYSNKMTKLEVKKLTFERTNVYKQYTKICNKFIEIINSKKDGDNLTKGSSLEKFFDDKICKEIYNKYAKIHNNLLNEIIKKINQVDYNNFKLQEINIQEARKEELIILDFENKNNFMEILFDNTFREIYSSNSKIENNNYNLYSIDFDKIEKTFEDTFIKNACFLKANEIVEMKYIKNDFLNDGIYEFNEKLIIESLSESDKKEFLRFYEKYLENSLESCLEINENIKNIIAYINKIYNVNNSKLVTNIINDGGFYYKINNNLKDFLYNNLNLKISKLSNLMLYLETLYFELAMKEKDEYNEKINYETKSKIDKYYTDKNRLLITKDILSITIIRFLINIEINKKNDKTESIDFNDNLFDYLNIKYLWNNEIFNNIRFIQEYEELKNLGIYVKNIYDFYSYISIDTKSNFEKEKKEILGKIRIDENEKLIKEKQEKGDKKEEKTKLKIKNENVEENQANKAKDIIDDDFDDLDFY